jgi:hypothetical protein
MFELRQARLSASLSERLVEGLEGGLFEVCERAAAKRAKLSCKKVAILVFLCYRELAAIDYRVDHRRFA